MFSAHGTRAKRKKKTRRFNSCKNKKQFFRTNQHEKNPRTSKIIKFGSWNNAKLLLLLIIFYESDIIHTTWFKETINVLILFNPIRVDIFRWTNRCIIRGGQIDRLGCGLREKRRLLLKNKNIKRIKKQWCFLWPTK